MNHSRGRVCRGTTKCHILPTSEGVAVYKQFLKGGREGPVLGNGAKEPGCAGGEARATAGEAVKFDRWRRWLAEIGRLQIGGSAKRAHEPSRAYLFRAKLMYCRLGGSTASTGNVPCSLLSLLSHGLRKSSVKGGHAS